MPKIYKLIAFGNVLLDSTFSIENDVEILRRHDLEPNCLGECSSESLEKILRDATKK